MALHWARPPMGDKSASASKSWVDVGVNIILAVSLNVVNGFTGQFSIGRAGFMAVGGYTAAAITYYCGGSMVWGDGMLLPGILSWTPDMADFTGPIFGGGALLFFFPCLVGGLVGAARPVWAWDRGGGSNGRSAPRSDGRARPCHGGVAGECSDHAHGDPLPHIGGHELVGAARGARDRDAVAAPLIAQRHPVRAPPADTCRRDGTRPLSAPDARPRR